MGKDTKVKKESPIEIDPKDVEIDSKDVEIDEDPYGKPGILQQAGFLKPGGSGNTWTEDFFHKRRNEVDPLTAAQVLMPAVMGSPGMASIPKGVMTSASLGNVATASEKAAENLGLLKQGGSAALNTVKNVASSTPAKYGYAYGLFKKLEGLMRH